MAPRRPTETALYALVRDHLETFLAFARESYQRGLPRYVEDELRGYLFTRQRRPIPRRSPEGPRGA